MYSKQLEIEQKLGKHNARKIITDFINKENQELIEQVKEELEAYNKEVIPGSVWTEYQMQELTMNILEAIIMIKPKLSYLPDGEIYSQTSVATIQNIACKIGTTIHENDKEAQFVLGADLLEWLGGLGLYELFISNYGEYDTCVVRPLIQATEEIYANLSMHQFLPPMICEPVNWQHIHYRLK